MAEQPCILVVDDEPDIRRFLCVALRGEGWQVREAASVAEALRGAGETHLHLVVLDLGLPDGDGVTFVRELRAWSAVPVLVLSARSEERDKVRALDAGADDYLAKPFGVAELLARTRALLRRALRTEVSPLLEFGDVRVDFSRREVIRAGQPVRLTPLEYRLLGQLAAGQGRVLTHRQLLREVWGPSYVDSPHYLRIYVGHLRQKLEQDPARPRHFLTETGVGYRFMP